MKARNQRFYARQRDLRHLRRNPAQRALSWWLTSPGDVLLGGVRVDPKAEEALNLMADNARELGLGLED
jgi:hypothetical protein